MIRFATLALLTLCACAPAGEPPAGGAHVDPYAEARPIAWDALLDRERETANHRIPYGAGELEFGELWLPDGPGPHPVVAMIHGGCWLAAIPGTILQDYLAADLRARGIAVWNLEYARIGHEDGTYPGTFLDIAQGIDHLRKIAPDYQLDLSRLVFTGHSAGGHLALWAAARGTLDEDSPLFIADPLLPKGVVTLAGINDLADYAAHGPGRCGEPETVAQLVGEAGYEETSPAQMLPLGIDQVVISGELDPIVPPVLGERYVLLAEASGDEAVSIMLPEAGHFELIDPTAPAWEAIRAELVRVMEAGTE